MAHPESEDRLDPPPAIELQELEDVSPAGPGFLYLSRGRYRTRYNGRQSDEFSYDRVERAALDAAIMAVHFERDGTRYVYLRSALRPPLQGVHPGASLWELPAGLIEKDEAAAPDGPRRCAAREIQEELGFKLPVGSIRDLGSAVYPVPGMCAERQYFFEVEVNPEQRGEPELDGSPLEENGVVIAVRLSAALTWCQQGRLPDGKTELGLRRLAEVCG